MADQFTSMVVVLYDMFFGCCFVLSDLWTEGNACMDIIPITRLCLAGLPGLWRFLQCLRRYRDSKDTGNLWNAGKYSSGLFVVLFAGLTKGLTTGEGFNVYRILLVVSSVIATGYTSYWDLVRDFGFFQKGSKHKFLRNELLYTHRFLYYAIIPTDVILRLTWIFTIAPASFGIVLSSDLLVFIFAASGITRRFLWNFFRMENESANNCGKFRAVKEIPLPDADTPDENAVLRKSSEHDSLVLDDEAGVEDFLNNFDTTREYQSVFREKRPTDSDSNFSRANLWNAEIDDDGIYDIDVEMQYDEEAMQREQENEEEQEEDDDEREKDNKEEKEEEEEEEDEEESKGKEKEEMSVDGTEHSEAYTKTSEVERVDLRLGFEEEEGIEEEEEKKSNNSTDSTAKNVSNQSYEYFDL